MVRLISRQRGGLAALKLTKLFGIDDFPAAKDSGKVLIIIIYCYLIIIVKNLLKKANCTLRRRLTMGRSLTHLDLYLGRKPILCRSCERRYNSFIVFRALITESQSHFERSDRVKRLRKNFAESEG